MLKRRGYLLVAQWVKDLALLLLRLRSVSLVLSLACELLHAIGMAKKKKKKRERGKKGLFPWYGIGWSFCLPVEDNLI